MHVPKELIEVGKFKPVIDRSYAMEEVVAAYEYLASGEKTGNIVLSIY
jgi:NADPH:quinone reductase-like Zn-dependent oxidoreductase